MFFERFFNMHVAKNGLEGLNKFNENKDIDLIITDLSMPKMSGVEMIKEIRKINTEIPIYALTAFFDDVKYVDECFELGVQRIIPKPMNIKEIMNFIEKDLYL